MNILISEPNVSLRNAISNYLRQSRPSWNITCVDVIPANIAYDAVITASERTEAISARKYLQFTGQSGRRLVHEIEKRQGGTSYAYHAASFQSLTPREREVLLYLGQGASNKDIARALHLQVATVKLHVRGICRKLGVSNRIRAALMAQYLSLH